MEHLKNMTDTDIKIRIKEKEKALEKLNQMIAEAYDQNLIWRWKNRSENLKMDIAYMKLGLES